MGYKHTREDILDGAVTVAYRSGLSRLSFGRVATELAISDRTVVYYFPTKADLIAAVLGTIGARLQDRLGSAGADPAPSDHLTLARRVWPLVAQPDADPTFGLFFEANGLAAAGVEPYARIVPELVEAWIAWAAAAMGFEPDEPDGRRQAGAAIALIDGLLLLRQLAGPDRAEEAAAALGVAPNDRER